MALARSPKERINLDRFTDLNIQPAVNSMVAVRQLIQARTPFGGLQLQFNCLLAKPEYPVVGGNTAPNAFGVILGSSPSGRRRQREFLRGGLCLNLGRSCDCALLQNSRVKRHSNTPWCNGNTAPFGGVILGSSPSGVAT